MQKDLAGIDFNEGAILLVDKPYGWSSFQLVNKLKRFVKAKIGHGGTLDPLATGLMLLATGKYTKKLNDFLNTPKEYTGTFYLGATTPSYDRETEPDNTFATEHITEELLRKTAQSMTGAQEQMPPVFSAVKVGGTRSYKLARQGETPELKARQIEIFSFEIEKIEMPLVHFRVFCTKGTYIRSLAHDFGKALHSGAYLHDLCRTRIGEYRLEDAWKLDELLDAIRDRKTDEQEV